MAARDMSDLALIGGAAAMMGLGCFLGGRASDDPKKVSFAKSAAGARSKTHWGHSSLPLLLAGLCLGKPSRSRRPADPGALCRGEHTR